MPPVLSSWAADLAAQELTYRCEQHPSGSASRWKIQPILFHYLSYNHLTITIYLIFFHGLPYDHFEVL